MPYEGHVDGKINLFSFEKNELEVALFSLEKLNVLSLVFFSFSFILIVAMHPLMWIFRRIPCRADQNG